MAARVVTVAFQGVDAVRVDVEVQFTRGDAHFILVGLGDKAVAESRERVRAAFTGLGLAWPGKRIIANLAPADLPKVGSHYDLPIALAIMAGMGVIPPDALEGWAALGELSLDGRIMPVAGALPAAVAVGAMGLGTFLSLRASVSKRWNRKIRALDSFCDPNVSVQSHAARRKLSTCARRAALEMEGGRGRKNLC